MTRGTAALRAWKLNAEQQRVFFEALKNLQAPNAKLRSAYQRYRKYKAACGGQ